MAIKYGKVFTAKKGKYKGKKVKYSYKVSYKTGKGMKSTKRMVLHRGRSKKRYYRRRY